MSISNDQLEARIIGIERVLSEVLTSLQGVATRNELIKLNVTKQSTLDDLQQRVTSLESQLTNLQLGLR